MDYQSLNDTHKKAAARRAVAKYATQPPHAVREYIRRTGMIELLPVGTREYPPYPTYALGQVPTIADLVNLPNFTELKEKMPDHAKAAQIYADAEEEMLHLLPGYRHPVNDGFAERMIFLAELTLDMTLTGYNWTPLMMEVKESLTEPLRSKVLKCMKDFELAKGKLNSANDELLELRSLLDEAHDDYQPSFDGERSDSRNKRVVQTLGLSTGRRQQWIDHEAAYASYVRIVRHKGLSRTDATLQIKNTFGYQSEDATLKALNKQLLQIINKWKQDSPQVFKSAQIADRLDGLILHRR
jgi:hypothetical protein